MNIYRLSMLDVEPALYALANLIGNSSIQTAPRQAVVLAPIHVDHAGPTAGARAGGH